MQSLKFEDKEVHIFQYKGKNGCIAIDLARAANLQRPADAVRYFIKSKSFLLVKGEDYEVLEGKDLQDLKDVYGNGKIPIPSESSKTSILTIFFEKAIYTFAGTKNGKGFERFQKWVFSSVIPSIIKTGRYDISEQDSTHILEKQNRPTQLNLSKEIASYLIEMFGEQAIPVYHNLTHLGFVGKTAKQLVAFANTLGAPNDVIKRGGREVLRYLYPEIPPCEAMQDELVTQGLSMDKAHESARKLVPFFQDMKANGMLKSASITTQLGLVPTPNYQSIKNPFIKLPKALRK